MDDILSYISIDNYEDICRYVIDKMLCKVDSYHNIEAIYARTKEEALLVKRYFELAHSYGCGSYRHEPKYDDFEFKGPDWYFSYYEPGDQYGPEEARLVSLSEKKERFKVMCDELDSLVANFTAP